MLSRHCNIMIKSINSCRVHCLSSVNYDVTCQTIYGSADYFCKQKLGTGMYFTNSLNYWPQRHCNKKASIEISRAHSVLVTSQLLAAGLLVNDVTIGQHFEAVPVKKCWFISLNAYESRKWSMHRMHGARNVGRYCSMSRHIGFRDYNSDELT